MILCNLSPFIFLPIAMFCISISCVAHFHRFNCKTSIICLPWTKRRRNFSTDQIYNWFWSLTHICNFIFSLHTFLFPSTVIPVFYLPFEVFLRALRMNTPFFNLLWIHHWFNACKPGSFLTQKLIFVLKQNRMFYSVISCNSEACFALIVNVLEVLGRAIFKFP